ncbi:hypothetical protein [Microlunatus sp. GCM10028923]|uniref:hypothetical protein n=1 Tax=Microlunatus sp. GCM10028923 TaxID=3273400 RepID=UPI00362260FA
MNRFWSGQVEPLDVLLVVFAAAAVAGVVTCVYVAIWLRSTQPAISGAVAMMAIVLALALGGIGWLGVRGRTVQVGLARSGVVLGSGESRLVIPWTDVARIVVEDSDGNGKFLPVRIQLSDMAAELDDPIVSRMFGGDGLALSPMGGLPAHRLDKVAGWAEHRLELV